MPPKQHDALFSEVASFSALHAAAKRAIKGKRRKPTPAAFIAGLEREILKLERAHAEHAQTWRLRHAMFRGGPFDPAGDLLFRDGPGGPKRKPGRSFSQSRQPRRLLKQQSEEPPFGEPQQERTRQPQQQSRVPGCPHALDQPGPGRLRTLRVCKKGVQDRS